MGLPTARGDTQAGECCRSALSAINVAYLFQAHDLVSSHPLAHTISPNRTRNLALTRHMLHAVLSPSPADAALADKPLPSAVVLLSWTAKALVMRGHALMDAASKRLLLLLGDSALSEVPPAPR